MKTSPEDTRHAIPMLPLPYADILKALGELDRLLDDGDDLVQEKKRTR